MRILEAPSSADPQPDSTSGATELRKPHEMIVLVPRSNRVTLTGRRLYNALMQVAQARLSKIETMPPADFMFEAPLNALLRMTGSNGEDRTAAKRYLREMRGLEVDWESTAPGDGVKWRGFSMLSEVAIEVRGGENWVAWSYPPTIMAAVKEPGRWARIDLEMLARLGTYAAVALYEICTRYRDNPSGVTSRKPVQWWINALSQAPAGAERREWRKFKNERIKDAVEQISCETDLEIELVEHKQGRAVVEAQFAVRRKRLISKQRQLPGDLIDANLILQAESLGIREVKLDGLVREFGDARVRSQVDVLERRAANNKLKGIENAYSYLRSLLRNDGAAGDDSMKAQAPSPAPAASPPFPAATPDSFQAADAQVKNERIAAIKRELAELDAEPRGVWIRSAIDDLRAKGLLSAVIQRRAAQGDWAFGLLGSTVVKMYATHTYGVEWDSPSHEAGLAAKS
jgi:hypothetical protein